MLPNCTETSSSKIYKLVIAETWSILVLQWKWSSSSSRDQVTYFPSLWQADIWPFWACNNSYYLVTSFLASQNHEKRIRNALFLPPFSHLFTGFPSLKLLQHRLETLLKSSWHQSLASSTPWQPLTWVKSRANSSVANSLSAIRHRHSFFASFQPSLCFWLQLWLWGCKNDLDSMALKEQRKKVTENPAEELEEEFEQENLKSWIHHSNWHFH